MFNMTPTVLQNLFKKKATRNYPAEERATFDNFRGELFINVDDCIFCSACQRKCPTMCITVDKEAGVWECNPFLCIACGICVDGCPTKCLDFKHRHAAPFAAREIIHAQGTPPKPKKKKKSAEPTEESAAE